MNHPRLKHKYRGVGNDFLAYKTKFTAQVENLKKVTADQLLDKDTIPILLTSIEGDGLLIILPTPCAPESTNCWRTQSTMLNASRMSLHG